jgi:hypothetical protein
MPDQGTGSASPLNLDVLRELYGDLILQIAVLKSENGLLRKQVVDLGRKIPPDPEDPKKPNDPKSDTS